MENTNLEHLDSDMLYKSIYDHILDAVLLTAPDGRVYFANKAACTLFGMTENDFSALGRAGIISPKDTRLEDLLEESKRNGQAKGELTLIKKNGTTFPAEASFSDFRTNDGTLRTCIVIHDLSAIRKVESQLRASEKLFRLYFENGPVGMCINTPGNEWSEINQEFCRLVGYEKEELLSMNWENITHPDDVIANKQLIESIKNGDIDHFKLDKRYIRKNGELLHATLSMVTTKNPDGTINNMIASFIDNTEHYKAVENLVQERHILRTLVDSLPFPIYFIDSEGKKVIANKADLANIGCFDERDVLGKTDEELFQNEVGRRGHADNMLVLQTGVPILDREEYFIDKNGEKRWLQTTKIPLFDSNHHITGLVGIGLDVTIQRMAKLKAEESDRLKTAFLQNISHEIRTPMNSINGFLEILEDPGFSRSEKKLYASIVNKSGQRLLNTINDIIEVSKIMTSNLELHPTMVNLYSVVDECYEIFKPRMDEKGLMYHLKYGVDRTLCMKIDEAKLNVVLFKILENAYKFTNDGSVDLMVERTSDDLIFKVKDTGIGIDPTKLSDIYEPFYQTDYNFNKKHEGAGLGLSISHAYVALFGGKMWIESSMEIGTTVYFSLPYPNFEL